MRVYISGKITGMDLEEAKDNFFRAEMIVRGMGLSPVNPMSGERFFNKCKKLPWIIYMIFDIFLLLRCTGIYLQENWEDSKGARIEYQIAAFFGYIFIKERMEEWK